MIKVYFHEKQTLPYLRKILMFGIITLVMLLIALLVYLQEWNTMPDSEKPFMLFLLAGPLVSIMIFFIGTEIRISNDSFEFKTLPFRRKFKAIPFDKITSFELRPARGIERFRASQHNRALRKQELYYGAKYFFTIRFKNGKHLLLGTDKPMELEHFLNHLPEGSPEFIKTDK